MRRGWRTKWSIPESPVQATWCYSGLVQNWATGCRSTLKEIGNIIALIFVALFTEFAKIAEFMSIYERKLHQPGEMA